MAWALDSGRQALVVWVAAASGGLVGRRATRGGHANIGVDSVPLAEHAKCRSDSVPVRMQPARSRRPNRLSALAGEVGLLREQIDHDDLVAVAAHTCRDGAHAPFDAAASGRTSRS